MNYFIQTFENYKKIFIAHRELLFNLINYQVFLRLVGFIVLFWVAVLFKNAMLEGSSFLLNYETFWPLLSLPVIFYWVLYIFLFALFILLEKIWLNLILYQNEKNPEFLLSNIYKEILKNLRKIIYVLFLEFAIVSFIIWGFLFFTIGFYIFAGMNSLFWMLEFLLLFIFWYTLIKAYLFFIFVNFEIFYVQKNVFEAFSLSIRWINKRKTISHLTINYAIIIWWIFLLNFLVTSGAIFLGGLILSAVNILTIGMVSVLMSFTFLLIILSSFLVLSLLSIIEFQIYKKEIRWEKPELNIQPPDRFNINKTVLSVILILFTITISIPLFFTLSDYNKSPLIVAHSWAPLEAPGNTISSIQEAIEQWADTIEIDVQETLDWEIVLFHDKNLRDDTGFNGNVYQTNYQTIETLEVGTSFSEEFIWEKIPTLEQILIIMRNNNIDLNIELKVYKKGQDYSKKVADLIKASNMQKRVVITSLDANILEKFSIHNNAIKRWLIVSLAVGDIFDNDFDFLSVNSKIISLPMLIRSKIAKKDLHIWIYNPNDSISDMLALSPDALIVDDIDLAIQERAVFQNYSDRKKLRIKIENIIDYLSGKIR